MTHSVPQNTLASARFAGRIKGVLFDIDETLVDLYKAMADAMIAASTHLLPDHGDAEWERFAEIYMADVERYYDRYVAGEFTFSQQRGLRARAVFERMGVAGFDAAAEARWIADFEAAQPLSIAAFADVVPLLDLLDAVGIPYGSVSNNVYDYQRAKLNQAGLGRISVLVGIDTVGVSKPAPEIFLEGCRQLDLNPAEVLYVGDNFLVDGVASVKAGLHGVWLNRLGSPRPEADDPAADTVPVVATLAQIPALLGLDGHPGQM